MKHCIIISGSFLLIKMVKKQKIITVYYFLRVKYEAAFAWSRKGEIFEIFRKSPIMRGTSKTRNLFVGLCGLARY